VSQDDLMETLGSVRLTLIVLAALLIMSIWGTLAPHRNVYHSPGYYAALILLAINLTVCTSRRLARKGRRFRQREWGYLCTHLGMLIILGGALVSLLMGFRALVFLQPGETINRLIRSPDDADTGPGEIISLGFEITLKRFHLELQDSGMPKEFTSELHLAPDGEAPRDAVITVNNPLEINGYNIYQASYQLSRRQPVTLSVRSAGNTGVQEYALVTGEKPLTLSGESCSPLIITALRYEPDFVMSGPGRFGSRSILPRNPAVQVSVRCGSDEPVTQWLFLRHRDVHHPPPGDGLDIRFTAVDQQYDTGLEFVKDPGTPWVTAGALILIAGLMLYLFPLKSRDGKSS